MSVCHSFIRPTDLPPEEPLEDRVHDVLMDADEVRDALEAYLDDRSFDTPTGMHVDVAWAVRGDGEVTIAVMAGADEEPPTVVRFDAEADAGDDVDAFYVDCVVEARLARHKRRGMVLRLTYAWEVER